MTGRELIVYILTNRLEDEPIIQDGRLVGFMTVEEYAAKMGMGVMTVRAMILLETLSHVTIGDTVYIPVGTC